MKKIITTLTLAIITSVLTLASTPDSMYVHCTGTNGDSIVVFAIANVDSIVYYAPKVPPATSGTFTDSRDSKTYNWVKIGEQIWMAENLAYLPEVHSNSEFIDFTGAATAADSIRYGVYGYDGTDKTAAKAETNYSSYGVLYNWYAAMAGASSSDANPSAVQGSCPSGWHLPSYAEWTTLEAALTGENKGSQLADNSDLWNNGDLEDNSDFGTSGFLALPGGNRNYNNGIFYSQGIYGYWWSSTQTSITGASNRTLRYTDSSVIYGNYSKSIGFSVRCVKD